MTYTPSANQACVPVHRSIIAVDIARSTNRANPAKAQLRRLMYSLLYQALRTSGIPEKYHDRPIDRGDGALILIRPADQAPKTILLTMLIPKLHQLLAHHNAHNPRYAFKLRVALHAGEVHYDQWGPYGEALDITCRLLNAPVLKQILTNTPAPVALVVSDDIYRSIIRHRYDDIDDRDFDPAVQIKIAGTEHLGWVKSQEAFFRNMWPSNSSKVHEEGELPYVLGNSRSPFPNP